MGNPNEDPLIELEKSYCPPVDSALFAALASDYDLSRPGNVEKLQEALDAIKGLAVEQEDLPFDPSGTANNHVDGLELAGVTSDNETSNPGHGTCHTQTDLTSLSSLMISSDGVDTTPRAQSKTRATYTIAADGSLELTGATHEDKAHSLAEMFPSVSCLDIEHALKKSKGDVSKSMDVLLNLAFFDETQSAEDDTRVFIPKGIDGFVSGSADAGHQRSRKKKRSKNQKTSLDVSSPSEEAPIPNKWETGTADIEFICSRTPDFPREKVKSTYYANTMSLPATIRAMALAAAPKEAKEIDDDPVMLAQVAELANDYHSIPTTTLVGLLRVTSNMISATNELAAIMMRQPQISVNELIKFTPTPLNLNDEDEDAFDPRSRGNESSRNVLSYEQARVLSEAHFAAGSAAYSQASQAARRAKSNHLYGGAAAVYRERGQEHRALAMQQLAVASDRLADRQSVNCDLDLHGVTVANALRISRDRVDAWWDSLGDAKYVRGGGKHVHGGFKIVTGVGLHSHDGTSRLGPAVSKMLMQDGWRVEVERGFILVVGKGRQ
ncbi:uncharacterized protein N7459_001366 [Penicillium hispanicum]|uniref:uncharacterized protein n=1 Tax=Penicillium hispanicum TaxID=1080232 RepID=UPI0025403B08|nr:uncharacterized protein N7459_001366 [Penicillium hispanicum]KAJ5595158.1 hypothetical protein N7459_001366 [Penicillium hispanicum]